MRENSIVGIDLAKNIFHVVAGYDVPHVQMAMTAINANPVTMRKNLPADPLSDEKPPP